MPASSIHNGWRWDRANSRLDFYYRGTRVGHINASGLFMASGLDVQFTDMLTGDDVATVADVNTEGGIPLVYRIAVAANGASNTTVNTDVTVVDKIRVIDAHAIHTAGAGVGSDTITVMNGSTAITDAMSWSGADNAIVRASTISDATYEIPASGTLRIRVENASTADDTGTGEVVVMAIKVT